MSIWFRIVFGFKVGFMGLEVVCPAFCNVNRSEVVRVICHVYSSVSCFHFLFTIMAALLWN
jgi:hypothetical protein